ncbi:MAG: hypothetical protein N3G22_00455 [Candidatus Micrarchaeota archaeon]|nr:hypothetical protein [Candidatus Micrarchaeota archaeon]
MAKGQLSTELLVVFLVFLALLGLSLAAIDRTLRVSQQKISQAKFDSAFADFYSKLESACSLGEGNVRHFAVEGGKASVSASGTGFTLSLFGISKSGSSSCEIEIADEAPSETFTISNKEGKLVIS